MGLANICVPDDKLDATVQQWAEEICEKSPTAIAFAKRSFDMDTAHQAGMPACRHGYVRAELVLRHRRVEGRCERDEGEAHTGLPQVREVRKLAMIQVSLGADAERFRHAGYWRDTLATADFAQAVANTPNKVAIIEHRAASGSITSLLRQRELRFILERVAAKVCIVPDTFKSFGYAAQIMFTSGTTGEPKGGSTRTTPSMRRCAQFA